MESYHVVRPISEVAQDLVLGDIGVRRDSDRLKAIRRGEWAEERLRGWFAETEQPAVDSCDEVDEGARR